MNKKMKHNYNQNGSSIKKVDQEEEQNTSDSGSEEESDDPRGTHLLLQEQGSRGIRRNLLVIVLPNDAGKSTMMDS